MYVYVCVVLCVCVYMWMFNCRVSWRETELRFAHTLWYNLPTWHFTCMQWNVCTCSNRWVFMWQQMCLQHLKHVCIITYIYSVLYVQCMYITCTSTTTTTHRDNAELATMLLNAGADPNTKSNGDHTPLILAAVKSSLKVLPVLLKCPNIRLYEQVVRGVARGVAYVRTYIFA